MHGDCCQIGPLLLNYWERVQFSLILHMQLHNLTDQLRLNELLLGVPGQWC